MDSSAERSLLLLAPASLVDPGRPPPGTLAEALTAWSFDPFVVLGLGAAAILYFEGRRRLRGTRAASPWRAWCFAAGLAVLGIALLSPIGTFDEQLFAVHMTQHLLLMLVAAPLLLLGAPLVPLLWGLPPRARRAVGGLLVPGRPGRRLLDALTHPWATLTTFLVITAAWHIPPLYDAAQGRTVVHYVEHGLFLTAALLFWWPVVHPIGGPRRLGYGLGVVYVVPPLLESNFIGAALALADTPLYQAYQRAPRISPLSVMDDQQLGGLIMWVPGGLFWAIPFFALVVLFLRHEEREMRRVEARRRAASGMPG